MLNTVLSLENILLCWWFFSLCF